MRSGDRECAIRPTRACVVDGDNLLGLKGRSNRAFGYQTPEPQIRAIAAETFIGGWQGEASCRLMELLNTTDITLEREERTAMTG